MAEAMAEEEQPQVEQLKLDEEKKSDSPSPKRSRSPHRRDQAPAGGSVAGAPPGSDQTEKVEEQPKQDSAMETEVKSLGRHLLDTLNSASQSLLECSTKLEKNVVLLEECRADSSSIQSLAAGVNYYASTTKASQAAATANHKQLAWDWLSDPREKQPLKETLKSVRYQCECTSKAAYQVVEVSKEILDELKSHKETMTEQTKLLKLIASNQIELSKLMKGTATPGGKGQAQPGTVPAAPSTPALVLCLLLMQLLWVFLKLLLPQEVLECPSRGSHRMPLSRPTHRSFLLRPLRRGDRSQESFGHINRRLPPTTSRTKAAIRPQRHTVGKKPQTSRGKWYMQLTATADLSEAFRPLPTPMIRRGR